MVQTSAPKTPDRLANPQLNLMDLEESVKDNTGMLGSGKDAEFLTIAPHKFSKHGDALPTFARRLEFRDDGDHAVLWLAAAATLSDEGGMAWLFGLFCEPFPRSTWPLPREFPLKALAPLLGTLPPSFIYAHLSHDYDVNDKQFFCGPDQHLLEKVPWMVLRSDQYFTPALFLVPTFQDYYEAHLASGSEMLGIQIRLHF
ncbi:hypothetical protein Taro_050828, partial [Colocasia esculenta]|nr:hypothetical protein [Colocasia esculenta]